MDVENYGIKLTLDGVAQATQQLDTFGAKGESSVKRVTASVADASKQMNVSAQAAKQMGVSLEQVAAAANGDAAAMRALATATQQAAVAANQNAIAMTRMTAPAVSFRREVETITRMAAPAVTGFKQLADAQEGAGKAAGVHGLSLGRVNMELGTAIGRFAGVNTAATRFAAMLGGSLAGYGQTIALLGAVVALVEVYKAWGIEADEAKKKQDELTKSLLAWYDTQREAGTYTMRKEIEATTLSVIELQAQLDKIKTGSVGGLGVIGQAPGGVFSSILRIASAGNLTEMVSQFATEIGKGTAKVVETVDKGNAAIDAATKSIGEALNANALAVAKQTALNDAFQGGAYALALINDAYEHRAALAKNAIDYTGAELVQANKLSDALYAQQQRAADLTEWQRAMNEQIEKSAAFWEKEKAALEKTAPQLTVNALWYKHIIDELKELNDAHDNEIVKIGKENAERSKAVINQIAEQIKQANKYKDDLSKIWRDGIAKITTDGFKSFLDFAQDLDQLFTRLMDRMAERARQLGKEAGGAGYAALGFGVAAIAGGVTGYQIGQQTGNSGAGIFGGALSGAAAGSAFGLPGTAIGAFVGAVSGLFGASKAQQEAAKAIRDSVNSQKQREADFIDTGQNSILEQHHQLNTAYESLYEALAQERQKGQISQSDYDSRYGALRGSYVDQYQQISDDFWKGIGQQLNALKGPAGDYANQLDAITQAYNDNLASADALHASEAQRAQVTELYTKQVEALNKAFAQANIDSQNSSLLRIYAATGQDDKAFTLQQSIEYQKNVDQGLDDISLRMLLQAQAAEAAQREAQKQTQILQDQLSTAQQQLGQLQQVYDSLDSFSKSLNIGQYSPLSPRQQLDASRGQLNALYQAALGGDVNAGNQFSSVAQQFLTSSRKYNASGAGYQLDFNSVSVMTEALKKSFGARISDTQQQINLLQTQIDKLNGIIEGVTKVTESMNDVITTSAAGSLEIVDSVADLKLQFVDLTTTMRRGLEAIAAAVA